ncbi:hypothetical protein HDU76_000622, partial [Blyttiomyces sp. JEL0837]
FDETSNAEPADGVPILLHDIKRTFRWELESMPVKCRQWKENDGLVCKCLVLAVCSVDVNMRVIPEDPSLLAGYLKQMAPVAVLKRPAASDVMVKCSKARVHENFSYEDDDYQDLILRFFGALHPKASESTDLL